MASTAVNSPNRLVSPRAWMSEGRRTSRAWGRMVPQDAVRRGRRVAGNRRAARRETCYDAVAHRVPTRHPDTARLDPWPPSPNRSPKLLDAALVGELTVVDGSGRPVTYPLIPLWDGEKVYLTSSTLFSRKLEHIRGNPKVSLSITDPVAVGGAHRPGDDPGRRPGHRRGPARRLGAAPPDLGEEGAVDRLLPQGAGRAAAVLRAGADRDHAAPRPLLADGDTSTAPQRDHVGEEAA